MRVLFLAMGLVALAGAARGSDAGPQVGGFAWSGWETRGGVAVSAPECVPGGAADGSGVACFARGQDGQLWRRAYDGREWLAWARAGGLANAAMYESRPECVASAARVDCFVRRHGDGAMFRRTWAGGYLHSWENLGGTLASDPDCVAQVKGRIDCFARGEDGALWQNAFDGDAWGGWIERGGELAEQTKPACALRSAGKIECLVVWEDKSLRHFEAASGDWDKVAPERRSKLPSDENLTPSPKCYGVPDAARVECFASVGEDGGRHALLYLRYDGDWTFDDLSSDFGHAVVGAGRDLAHYDFDCIVRAGDRYDCMELAAWRGKAEAGRAVVFRHYSYVLGGPPSEWRVVPLVMPVQSGNVTFLKCLSADGERIDCFTGGSWTANATLNQASYVYQERIVYRPMKPVR